MATANVYTADTQLALASFVIRCFDLDSGKSVKEVKLDTPPGRIALSPNEQHLAIAGRSTYIIATEVRESEWCCQ